MVKKNSAAKNISCEEKCQSAMAVSTEFVTNKAEIAKMFKEFLRYEDIVGAAGLTAMYLDIKQGTKEMQYLLDYIYNRTGEIVCYWNNTVFVHGERFVSLILGDITRYIDGIVAKSNYPTRAFGGKNTRSLKESIAKELFLEEYHENSKRF